MSLVLGGFVRANPSPQPVVAGEEVAFPFHSWKAVKKDNICGLTDLDKVSSPAQVDYDELLKATPQMKEIDKKGIDVKSAEGKALVKEAKSLITKSAELERGSKSYCSVWKSISHKDGRKIPDITDAVIDRY